MVPGGRGSQVSRQSAHEGGKVVRPTHRPPLPLPPPQQEIYLVLIFVSHSAAGRITWMKNHNGTMGIEPATFRAVAQCLNQLRQRVPPNITADLLLQTLCNFAIIKILITNINGWQARNNLAERERERERESESERSTVLAARSMNFLFSFHDWTINSHIIHVQNFKTSTSSCVIWQEIPSVPARIKYEWAQLPSVRFHCGQHKEYKASRRNNWFRTLMLTLQRMRLQLLRNQIVINQFHTSGNFITGFKRNRHWYPLGEK